MLAINLALKLFNRNDQCLIILKLLYDLARKRKGILNFSKKMPIIFYTPLPHHKLKLNQLIIELQKTPPVNIQINEC